ncbi:MAG: hypothetical protein ACI4PF_02480 [Christensenellales bacterium]
MWEITLIGNSVDYMYFVMLEEELKSTLKDKVIFAMTLGNGLTCSIAIKDKRYINFVKTSVLECIIKIVKEEYFKEHLKIKRSDEELNNFILMSLVLINLQEEIDYARVRIKLTKTIHIRSLMNFKLNKFYFIWDRLIDYFNSQLGENQDEIYLEFLKILANNTHSKTEIMYLEQIRENMCILDKDKQLIITTPKDDEIGVVVNLIAYAPKKIIINCYDTLSTKVAELIKYIFEDKISVLL